MKRLIEVLQAHGVPAGEIVEAQVHLSTSIMSKIGVQLWDHAKWEGDVAFKKVGARGDWIRTELPLYTGAVRRLSD